VDRAGSSGYFPTGGLHLASAWLAIERDDRVLATERLERSLSVRGHARAVPWWSIYAGIVAGKVAIALGDMARAESILAQARREITRLPDAGVLPTLLGREERALESRRNRASALREPLTEAELRVLRLAPTHLTLEEIGRELAVSRNTVKTHLTAIYGKLSAASRGEAVARARTLGVLDSPG
jgi:LuxR family maltose regulon positive regulatory protein